MKTISNTKEITPTMHIYHMRRAINGRVLGLDVAFSAHLYEPRFVRAQRLIEARRQLRTHIDDMTWTPTNPQE